MDLRGERWIITAALLRDLHVESQLCPSGALQTGENTHHIFQSLKI